MVVWCVGMTTAPPVAVVTMTGRDEEREVTGLETTGTTDMRGVEAVEVGGAKESDRGVLAVEETPKEGLKAGMTGGNAPSLSFGASKFMSLCWFSGVTI